MRILIPLFALAISFTGCSSLRKASDSMGKWSADELTPGLAEPVDIISLLTKGQVSSPENPASFNAAFDAAIVTFNANEPATQKLLRNQIQDRLKVSADQLCDEYKANVIRKQARGNFWLGTTSLFLGTTGALVKGIDAARSLSGSAAFFTGIRSEYNQDFYLDQTIAVISKAIDKRQIELYQSFKPSRDLEVSDYTVIRAINDISNYHAACSLHSAISFTDKAVEKFDLTRSAQEAEKINAEFNKLKSPPQPPK